MSKSDAVEWIRDNLPTEAPDWTDDDMVVVEHDTDGETVCSICDRPHRPKTEFCSVELLAEKYYEVMDTRLPDQAADAAREAVGEAQNRDTGHERFFKQYLD